MTGDAWLLSISCQLLDACDQFSSSPCKTFTILHAAYIQGGPLFSPLDTQDGPALEGDSVAPLSPLRVVAVLVWSPVACRGRTNPSSLLRRYYEARRCVPAGPAGRQLVSRRQGAPS